MKIETKFDIGQKVYYIHSIKDKIEWGVISRITTECADSLILKSLSFGTYIGYQLGTSIPLFLEEQLFATREEAEKKLKEISK